MFLKAAYTVEAAFVVSICLFLLAGGILLSFQIYHESLRYIEETQGGITDVVQWFRLFSAGKEIGNLLLGD